MFYSVSPELAVCGFCASLAACVSIVFPTEYMNLSNYALSSLYLVKIVPDPLLKMNHFKRDFFRKRITLET